MTMYKRTTSWQGRSCNSAAGEEEEKRVSKVGALRARESWSRWVTRHIQQFHFGCSKNKTTIGYWDADSSAHQLLAHATAADRHHIRTHQGTNSFPVGGWPALVSWQLGGASNTSSKEMAVKVLLRQLFLCPSRR